MPGFYTTLLQTAASPQVPRDVRQAAGIALKVIGVWGCVWKGGLSVVGRWLVHTVYIRPTDTPSIPINNCPNPTRRQNAIKQNWELGDEARAKGQQPPPEAVREEEKVRLFMCMWCVTSG